MKTSFYWKEGLRAGLFEKPIHRGKRYGPGKVKKIRSDDLVIKTDFIRFKDMKFSPSQISEIGYYYWQTGVKVIEIKFYEIEDSLIITYLNLSRKGINASLDAGTGLMDNLWNDIKLIAGSQKVNPKSNAKQGFQQSGFENITLFVGKYIAPFFIGFMVLQFLF